MKRLLPLLLLVQALGCYGGPTGTLRFDRDSVSFWNLGIRKEKTARIELINELDSAAVLESIRLQENPGGVYRLSTGSADCSSGLLLDPGESCHIEVTFAPQDPGAYEAHLAVSYRADDGGDPQTLSAPVTGEGRFHCANPPGRDS